MILSLQARIEDLNEQLLKLKEILKSSKARENNLTEDLENLNQEMRGKQKIINKLHKEKDEVDKENEELKKRIKRLMSSTQVKGILLSDCFLTWDKEDTVIIWGFVQGVRSDPKSI